MSLKRQAQIFGKALKMTFCKSKPEEDDLEQQLDDQFEQIVDIAREANERSRMLLSRFDSAIGILDEALDSDFDCHMTAGELKVAMIKARAALAGVEPDDFEIWAAETIHWMKDHENDEEES